jgi:spermidine synthase
MRHKRLFLAAYACSGVAGLIYEVGWTRTITLYMGHSTAAVSTVAASFMGGLAIGSFAGGHIASRVTRLHALYVYVLIECLVGLVAAVMPYEFSALTPLLAWTYRDGTTNLFPVVRLLSCLGIITIPAVMLGATFPLAVRAYITAQGDSEHASSVLYSANTAGAAAGALGAGFSMVPLLGVRATTLVGVGGSCLAAFLSLLASRSFTPLPAEMKRVHQPTRVKSLTESRGAPGIAMFAVGISGFAGLLIEIVWTRVLSLVVGPTVYAFSATLAAFISGMALGAALGSWTAAHTRRPAVWLAVTFSLSAIATTVGSSLAVSDLPLLTVRQISQSAEAFSRQLPWHALLAAAVMMPAAAAIGAVFPLALHVMHGSHASAARRASVAYMVNALAAVAGALLAGFVIVPWLGLRGAVMASSALLIVGSLVVAIAGLPRRTAFRGIPAVFAGIAIVTILWNPAWDRDLLASGAYRYAPSVDSGLDVAAVLKAGTVLYYRDGAAATVSVRQLTGNLSLAIDGKIDASNAGDMLTQKALAHLPLLLHPDPHDVCIIGLGSGVTLAAALVHPIARADVLELSPEVVDASRYFSADNHNALDDPRTHLIVGDGRSHLLLSSRKYDVIISEPSNPWMAGVAALFTQEFFTAARDHLSPGGIICQWGHTYDISDGDLRSIAATFSSVFPRGTMWLIGESDLLFIASTGPLDPYLTNLERTWRRPGVAADLRTVSALEPFAFWSAYVGGPRELHAFGAGATIQRDDRMALEFSGPRSLFTAASRDNAHNLLHLLNADDGPPYIRHVRDSATAAEWQHRGSMLHAAHEYASAYESYRTAFTMASTDQLTLDGLVQTAIATHREAETLATFAAALDRTARPRGVWIALSQLHAASGSIDDAITAARRACAIEPIAPAALDQLASIFSDLGDAPQLEPIVARMTQLAPDSTRTLYFSAALEFIHGRFVEALDILQQTVARDRSYAAAYNMMGAIDATLGRYQAARDALHIALRLSPRDSAVYINLGLLELTTGHHLIAATHFADALSIDPGSEAARQGLAQAK